jgi:hypothetical protein
MSVCIAGGGKIEQMRHRLMPSREHARLIILLLAAADVRGGQAALARELDLDPVELSNIINGQRFVTTRQAIHIEAVLGVSARQMLIEAAMLKVDYALARERGVE